MVFRNKAQCAGNGRTLVKHCNAVAGHHRSALRVSLSGSTDCVVPLDKGVARADPASGAQPTSEEIALAAASALGLACEARLAVNPDKLTEPAIMLLEEH